MGGITRGSELKEGGDLDKPLLSMSEACIDPQGHCFILLYTHKGGGILNGKSWDHRFGRTGVGFTTSYPRE